MKVDIGRVRQVDERLVGLEAAALVPVEHSVSIEGPVVDAARVGRVRVVDVHHVERVVIEGEDAHVAGAHLGVGNIGLELPLDGAKVDHAERRGGVLIGGRVIAQRVVDGVLG